MPCLTAKKVHSLCLQQQQQRHVWSVNKVALSQLLIKEFPLKYAGKFKKNEHEKEKIEYKVVDALQPPIGIVVKYLTVG